MDTGSLNRRIQIQAQTPGEQDAFGQPTAASWATVYTCWASISVQASQLLYETSTFVSKVTHRIEARWTSSFIFAANQRIVYTEATTGVVHTFNIEAVLNDKQGNRKLILLAYELNAQE
jgi:head-tail adaptor